MHDGRSTLLTAPAPELENLSFALSEPESVGEWIGRLPMANVPETAGQIRQAIFEIARLDTDWATRMALLEGIRPTVLYLTARLDKAANSAGASADAITRLAQRLQTNLCSGYKAVVIAAQDSATTDTEASRTLSQAIHRALSDLSRTRAICLHYMLSNWHWSCEREMREHEIVVAHPEKRPVQCAKSRPPLDWSWHNNRLTSNRRAPSKTSPYDRVGDHKHLGTPD